MKTKKDEEASTTSVRPFAHPADIPHLLGVREAATLLGVSASWIRRRTRELPTVRVGRLVRFDSVLLLRRFRCTQTPGNRSKPEGTGNMQLRLRRYQRGYVYKTGNRTKAWYGMWRDDVKLPDGSIRRRQRNLRLGTVSELPTKAAAQEALRLRISSFGFVETEWKFFDLVERWRATIVPTIRVTTAMYYEKILRA